MLVCATGTSIAGKAIYVCEQTLHTSFRLGAIDSVLPYRYRENRVFHLALFRHCTWLLKRSCPRTALEVAYETAPLLL